MVGSVAVRRDGTLGGIVVEVIIMTAMCSIRAACASSTNRR